MSFKLELYSVTVKSDYLKPVSTVDLHHNVLLLHISTERQTHWPTNSDFYQNLCT